MRRYLLALLFMSLSLGGCSYFHVYHPEIQQGNIVTEAQMKQLKVGMSAYAVKHVLGDPVLTNTFADQSVAYIYSIENHRAPREQKSLILTIKGNVLTKIERQNPTLTVAS